MSYESASRKSPKKLKINWAKECVVGALLSAAFTIMASNSGAEGVTDSNFAHQIHNFIILGGVAMGLICSLAAVGLIFAQVFENMARSPASYRFIKIFLP